MTAEPKAERERKEVLCRGTRLERTKASGSTGDSPKRREESKPMGVLRNTTAPKKKARGKLTK